MKFLKIIDMLKKSICVLALFGSFGSFAQTGVNTLNPQQVFHFDGKLNESTVNPKVGIPSAIQQSDDVVITSGGSLGLGTINPTEKLDVNGKLRIRDTEILKSGNVSPIFIDENGVVGKSIVSSGSSPVVFCQSDTEFDFQAKGFNTGSVIVIPITEENVQLNTLNTQVSNNIITIPDDGFYQITGSLNLFMSTNKMNDQIYVAFNVQVSKDKGKSWKSVSGYRPIFITAGAGTFYYGLNLPVVLQQLAKSDLIRMVIYRTRASDNVLQGGNLVTGKIQSQRDHGTKAYSLSILKF